MKRIARVARVVLFVLAAACGARAPGGAGRGGARPPASSLHAAVALVGGDGAVEARARDAREWAPLARGASMRDVVGLRVTGGGAVLDVGDGRGRLWLKDGSAVDLGQDERGEVRVLVARGEARLRHGARDELFFSKEGRTEARDTEKNLAEADFSLQLETAREPRGIGALEARAPNGQIAPVSLKKVDVRATQVGDYVETEVEHVFSNETNERLEGTFRFPMPDGAILTGLAMEIGGKLMEGELVEREKAEKVYQEIVDEMRDPALLEWEHGNVFKLRVFPIEPNAPKRVVLRFVAPLHRGIEGWEFVYPTTAMDPASRGAALRVELAGKGVVAERPLADAADVVVPLGSVPGAVREARADGVYTAVRVRPDWAKIPAPPAERPARRVVLVVDTSRSALEARSLELDAMRALLGELGPDDRFAVIASDVAARPASPDLAPVAPAEIERAAQFVERFEPDGASDLGAALRAAGELARASRAKGGKEVEIVYVGDGTPTWGETEPAKLAALAKTCLAGARLHAVLLGAAIDAGVLRELVASSGGQSAAPRTALDVKRFALRLARAPNLRQIAGARVIAREGDVVYPATGATLVEGDEIVAVIKTPKGEAAPIEVKLEGEVGSKPFVQAVALGRVEATTHVAQRWAKEQIALLEKDKKADAIRASLAFGVMSKYTSFLVLESEEAYAKYDIARKSAKKEEEDARRVSGADLESVGGRNARLEPDHLQPGDPEIRIPAPADAQRVVVVLPFGETKIAEYEAGDVNAWTARFLVDKDTLDGTYTVTVRITHRDGAIEVLELPYVVDTQRPSVEVSLRALAGKPGTYEIRARQVITMAEIVAASGGKRPDPRASLEQLRARYASILTDVHRVEVRLPDGEVLPLTAIRLGDLRAQWTPAAPLTGPVTLHVVAVDRAMNQSAFDATVRAR